MNEYCRSCPDKRNEICPLPGRIVLFLGQIGEAMVDVYPVDMLPTQLHSEAPNLLELELKNPAVASCRTVHMTESFEQSINS